MSDIEHRKGKLIPLYKDVCCTLEEKCRKLADENGWDIESYDDMREMIAEEGYRKYYLGDYALYKIDDEEVDPYDDITHGVVDPDGTVEFEIKWYNGGASMSEMIDEVMKNALNRC